MHAGRNIELAVHLPHSLLLQPADGRLPLPLHVAQGIVGVDVGDLEGEAVDLVVGDQRLGQNLQAGTEPATRFGLEAGGDAGIAVTPNHGAGLSRGNAVVAPFFDQFQIAVARTVDLDFRDFGTHPHGQLETLVERLPDGALQLAQGDMPHLSHQPKRMPSVSKRPNSCMLRAVSPRQTLSSSPWSIRTILRHVRKNGMP